MSEEEEINDNSTNPISMDRFKVSISEITQLHNRLREINDNEIHNVDFLDENGLPIKIEEKTLDDWKFTGLNITDFINSKYYLF